MVLVCIRSYVKTVLEYRVLILNKYHADALYARDKFARIRGYFSNTKWVLVQ